ncbi:MAG: hypothetical protein M3083_24825 [Actinomycetota bacterium]|nr:hypothetical protein [Actinomycetota bacterium]
MRRIRVGFVTLAVAVLGVSAMVVSVTASAAQSATPAGANINFSPNLTGRVNRSVIPANPPVESWRLTAEGTAAPLGRFNYVSNLTVHFGIDGMPLSITDGVGAFTGDAKNNSGDAIFFTLSGVFQRGGDGKFDAVFIVTGGTGRFVGLFGSGRIAASADVAHNTFVGAWDGLAKRPGG